METGYPPKTKMSEFDRFLPHLKKINHHDPDLGSEPPDRDAEIPRELSACANDKQQVA